jgi:maltokinase
MRSTEDLGTAALEQALAGWLPTRRWFAGKGRPITGLAVAALTELTGPGEDPALWHLLVDVIQGTVTDRYQLLAGLRGELPGRLEHVRIGTLPGGRTVYDALHDHELARVLLRGIADERSCGPLRFGRLAAGPFTTGPQHQSALASEDIESLVLTGEQSNTSLVYGEEAILKVFRRVAPGPNPDLEVSIALSKLGSPHVAAPLGWIETRVWPASPWRRGSAPRRRPAALSSSPIAPLWAPPPPGRTPSGSPPASTEAHGPHPEDGGQDTVLAILSQYLRAATDGWSLAATSVRDLYAEQDGQVTGAGETGGDFAGEANRLGAATAAVHAGLASAFGTDEEPPGAAAELAAGMRHRLEEAVTAVPALRAHAHMLAGTYTELAGQREPIRVQRIHGDYHLGQVLRTQSGWVVLDFEGEPAAPLATRRGRFSALRDVAGMLRSFDYAARHQLLGHSGRDTLELAARDWVARNTDAFCAGYAEASGTDPRGHATLLRALTFDKAVYEVLYEARNRPSWLPIPLDSLTAAQPAGEAGEGDPP